ncbi:hypothetical protein AB0Q95_44470 [Streptomyces sp. NPDC059900]|uniref:hypothetical protein n=1 Tax=Streptomyces sp. NPDC059900 TaxID=3155816 RepID=UPI0034320240
MSGGLPPLRDRHLAAGFIVVMYVLVGAMVGGVFGAGFARSELWGGVAALVGGALGAGFAVWRIRRTPEEEREDDSGYF